MQRRNFVKNFLWMSCGLPILSKSIKGNQKDFIPVVLELESKKFKRVDDDIRMDSLSDVLFNNFNTHLGTTWSKLFDKNDRVGIKVSCLPGIKLSSSVNLVRGIVECLKKIGIKSNNIIVWERTKRELTKAGFLKRKLDCRVIGTDELSGGGYFEEISVHRSIGSCFSRIFGKIDSLINVPVLKDHDLSGISAGMKNFFGGIHNPNKFHSNNCNPYIADLSTHPQIKTKLKMIVCDASRIQYHNGPAYSSAHAVEYGKLLISTDPVALDYQGWQIIEKQRKIFKYPDLLKEERKPEYILTAQKYGLGSISTRIKRINLDQ